MKSNCLRYEHFYNTLKTGREIISKWQGVRLGGLQEGAVGAASFNLFPAGSLEDKVKVKVKVR